MTPLHPRRPGAAVLLGTAVVASLALASAPASASITATTVEAPAPDTILETTIGGLRSGDSQVTIHGTAVGAAPGELLDIVCTVDVLGEPDALPLEADVPVGPDGRFSVQVDKWPYPCRVRAVPADWSRGWGEDTLAAYRGPRVLGGLYAESEVGDATGPAAPRSFQSRRSQRGGLAEVVGLAGSAATSRPAFSAGEDRAGLQQAAYTEDTRFRSVLGSAGLIVTLGERVGEPDSAQLTVDGAPATVADEIGQDRLHVVSKQLDPVTGDLEVTESAPVALVVARPDDDGYALRAAGLVLERTYRQDHDGRLFTFRDTFRSTDGVARRVTVTYGAALGDEAVSPTFRIPWVTGEAYAAFDDAKVPPAPAGPVTFYASFPASVRQDTSGRASAQRADGSPIPNSGGEAGYAFDVAPGEARFLGDRALAVRIARDVPAGGAATVTHRYAQGITRAEVDELLRVPAPSGGPDAPGSSGDGSVPPLPSGPAVRPVAPPAGPFPGPAAVDPLGQVRAAARKALLTRSQATRLRRGKAITLTAKGVPAGRYAVAIRRSGKRGPAIAAGTRTLGTDGTVRLRVRLTAAGRRWFASRAGRRARSLKAGVTVSWTPKGAKKDAKPRTSTSVVRIPLR